MIRSRQKKLSKVVIRKEIKVEENLEIKLSSLTIKKQSNGHNMRKVQEKV